MPYATYGLDMRKAWNSFRKPAKNWVKAAVKIRDPLKLFEPTMIFVVHGFVFVSKALFFTARKALNH